MIDVRQACGARGLEKGGGGRLIIVENVSMMSGNVIAIGLGGSSET